MPRKRADDGSAPAPKAPRQRRKKGEAAAEAAALAAAAAAGQPNEMDMPGTSGPGGMPFDPSMCGMGGPGAHPSPAAMLHRQNSATGHFMPTDDPTGGGMYGPPGGAPPGGYYLTHPGAHPGMGAPQPPPPYDMQSPHHPGSMSATPQAPTPGAATPQPMQMPPPFGADPAQMAAAAGQIPPPGYGFAHPATAQGGPGAAQQPPYNMRTSGPAAQAPPPQMNAMFPMNYPLPPFFEFRIHEINRRIYEFAMKKSEHNPDSTKVWWDTFAMEFFDDEAEMHVAMCDSQDPARRPYKVGRSMIPRFFRSAFDNGVTELFYECRTSPKEEYVYGRPPFLVCNDLLMITRHDRPLPFEVHTECRLFVEFGAYDQTWGCRIRRWNMEMRNCQEYFHLPKDQPISPDLQEMIRRGVSRMGLPSATIWHLDICSIVEPMQEIMSIVKTSGNKKSPREAMKALAFEMYQRRQLQMQQQQEMMMRQRAAQAAAAGAANPMGMNPAMIGPPPAAVDAGGKQKAPRKRQRKSTASNGNGTTGGAGSKKKGGANQTSSPTTGAPAFPGGNVKAEFPSPSVQPNVLQFPRGQYPPADVLVVGEPSMMGSVEFGEEDERSISRIENTQYDPSAAGGGGAGPPGQNPMFGGGGMPTSTSHGGTNASSTPTSNTGGGMGMPPHGYMNDFAMPHNVTEPSGMNWPAPPSSMPVGASPASRRY